MTGKRPTGVIVIGILAILGGLASLIVGLTTGIAATFFGEVAKVAEMAEAVVPVLVILGVIMLIVGILRIVSGIGLFVLKDWARKLAIWMAALDIVINILGMIRAGGFRISPGYGIINIIIAAVIIWYLFKSSTVAAFRPFESEQPSS